MPGDSLPYQGLDLSKMCLAFCTVISPIEATKLLTICEVEHMLINIFADSGVEPSSLQKVDEAFVLPIQEWELLLLHDFY